MGLKNVRSVSTTGQSTLMPHSEHVYARMAPTTWSEYSASIRLVPGRRIARVVCSLLVIAQVLSASFLWRPRRRESVRLVTSGDRVHDAGGVRSCRKVSTLLSCQSVSLAGSSRLF